MHDETPAPTAGAAAFTPAQIERIKHGFFRWYYRPDTTQRTRAERIEYLRTGSALLAANGTMTMTQTPEQTDALLLSLWVGTPAADCQA